MEGVPDCGHYTADTAPHSGDSRNAAPAGIRLHRGTVAGPAESAQTPSIVVLAGINVYNNRVVIAKAAATLLEAL